MPFDVALSKFGSVPYQASPLCHPQHLTNHRTEERRAHAFKLDTELRGTVRRTIDAKPCQRGDASFRIVEILSLVLTCKEPPSR